MDLSSSSSVTCKAVFRRHAKKMYLYFSGLRVSHQSLLKAEAQQRNQRLSNGESSNSDCQTPQNRAVCATSPNYADAPADACKLIHFVGSGVGKDSHLLEQKKYCNILALVLKKCL